MNEKETIKVPIMQEDKYTGLEIAVIGMAGRFPGAKNIEEFWHNLENGIESISFFTDEELEDAGVSSEALNNPNYIKASGLLEDIEYFDASFFSYSPGEAQLMNPQVRIFHECAWEAIENAGYTPNTYDGSIGLYAGASHNVEWEIISYFTARGELMDDSWRVNLMDKDYLCSRISYRLNLRGPSVLVQTTCSTSLAAIHMACHGLLTGECDLALAGGVSITKMSKSGYWYHEGMVNSPDGHCRAFDAEARGTVVGDGVGVVVLKILEDALSNGDFIDAVIKGSALNNDGSVKVGFAAPSVEGQSKVIKAALIAAEVESDSINYIETHGNGTALGDPVEIEALKIAFNTNKKRFCAIGSVKTNIGNLNEASGVAGFIKTVLALKYKIIPPSLHFETPNPTIDFENSPFYVNTKACSWESKSYPLRAGVSSLGVGGTNVHVILEEAPKIKMHENDISSLLQYQVIVLSAKTPTALDQVSANLAAYFKNNPGMSFANVAFTLQKGRDAFNYRRMMVCSTVDDAVKLLESPDTFYQEVKYKTFSSIDNVAFIFPGEGSQYVNMGFELYKKNTYFAETIKQCSDILQPLLGFDIKEILYPDSTVSTQAVSNNLIQWLRYSQVIIFMVEYALATLISKWGIKPWAMVGYQVGEYVVACLSGVFSLEGALKLVALRCQLMRDIPGESMLHIPLSGKDVKPLLNEYLSVAVSDDAEVIVCGPTNALEKFREKMRKKNLNCTQVKVTFANYPITSAFALTEFEREVCQLKLNPPQIPFVSSITGDWIKTEEAQNPLYWVEHLKAPVCFGKGIRVLQNASPIFVEVGPGQNLREHVQRVINEKKEMELLHILQHPWENISDVYQLLETVGKLWLYGVNVDWDEFHSGEKRYRLHLPTYPFERIAFPIPPVFLVERLKTKFRKLFEDGKAQRERSIKVLGSPHLEYKRDEMNRDQEEHLAKTERKLLRIWRDFFGLGNIGINDDFFEMGGDSLKAIILISKIERMFEIKIPLIDFFILPTIKDLAKYLIHEMKQKIFYPIEPAEKKEYYPLSAAQTRLFFLQMFDIESIAYNIPQVLQIEGNLDREKIEIAFKKLIERHESLRTSFVTVDGEPFQRIHPLCDLDFKIEYYLMENKISRNTILDQKIETTIKKFIRPFDFSRAPLIRIGFVEAEESLNILMLDMAHIITDGYSMSIILKELTAFYRGEELPELQIQYKDFSQWRHTIGQQLKIQEAYWLREFSDELPILNLPTDFPRPIIKGFEGITVEFQLGKEENQTIRKIAKRTGSTRFMILLSFYYLLLSKLSGQEDIVVGTPISGRNHVGLENIVGMFVNTLALRNYPKGKKTFVEFLQEVRVKSLNAFENQDYPFENLVEKLDVPRDISRNPLFDTMFSFQVVDDQNIHMQEGLVLKPINYQNNISKFDLSLNCIERADEITLQFEYSTGLFRKETIERFIKYFKKLTTEVITNPEKEIAKMVILPEEEKRQIIYEFNGNRKKYPTDKTLTQLFEIQVEKTPDNIALSGGNQEEGDRGQETGGKVAEKVQLTYRVLKGKSNQLAHVLNKKGVELDTIVGIKIGRSIEMIIGILGILKAGGAYLPIDPNYPEARIDYILEDSGAKILLTNSEIQLMDETSEQHTDTSKSLYISTHVSLADSLAYVIYTSGSSGRPKGVPITHANISPLLHWGYENIGLIENDRAIQNLSFIFDWSVWEIFLTLTSGASLHMVSEGIHKDPYRLNDFINTNRITFLNITPVYDKILISTGQKMKSLKYLILGADRFSYDLLLGTFAIVSENCRIFNSYGPTEAAIISAALEIDKEDYKKFENLSSIPIGKPIANTYLLVLDEDLLMCPPGIMGELYIAGNGLTKGYLRRPELNATSFIDNIYEPDGIPGKRLYKSGDLVRWLPDGIIEFIGRKDYQVKIRGFRIEMGEIENQLLSHDKIKEAVVMMKEDMSQEKYLCAYIVWRGDKENRPYGTILKKYLSQKIPDYMIPKYFVFLDCLPLLPNGKIDRKALPEPEIDDGDEYVAPRDEVEEILTKIWSEFLGIGKEKIGIDHNFFDLGGHSLNAIVMASRINEALNVEVSFVEIFNSPTIRGMAQYLKKITPQPYDTIEPAEEKEYYPLSSAQKRVFILQQLDIAGTSYNMPSVSLLEGEIDKEKLNECFQSLINRHESFRTSFSIIKGVPVQKIHRSIKLSAIYDAEKAELERTTGLSHSIIDIINNFSGPFDLTRAPLLRVQLIKENEKKHFLLVEIHHIISDGISIGIFIKELITLYNGTELETLRIQYKDYSEWLSNLKNKEQIRQQKAYWLQEFTGEVPLLHLPTDYPRPAVQSFEGNSLGFKLAKKEVQGIKRLAAEGNATLFIVLLASYSIFLSKLSGQEDIVIGTPIAGRRHVETDNIIGMFVNMLALKTQPTGDKTFKEFLEETKQRILEAFENQEYPFEELVEIISLQRDTSRNPLIDVVFSFQGIEHQEPVASGLKLTPYPYKDKTSKFDLTLFCSEEEEKLSFTLEYCTRLFKMETIERFSGYFKKILSTIVANPGTKICDIEIISAEERTKILHDFNDTRREYPHDKTIHQLFEELAANIPHHIAVICEDSQHYCRSLTYGELNEKADRFAGTLQENGIQEEGIIGIIGENSLETIIGIIGILKAGGAYLPIDPGYPQQRIDYMLKDSAAKILVSSNEIRSFLFSSTISLLNITQLPKRTHSSHLAYVMFSSGSTGRPKGIMIDHINVVRLVKNIDYVDFRGRERILQTGAFSFDASTFEIWGTLLNGCELYLLDKDVILYSYELRNAIRKFNISLMWLTSPLFNQLDQVDIEIFAELRNLIVGGDVLSPPHINRLRNRYKELRILNAYGPTENTTFSTTYSINKELETNIPIGKSINNSTAYIIDKYGKLAPVGVVGELLVGGDGLARGYLNNPALTVEKFIKSPFRESEKLYVTGDLARWLPDGNIEFLGRKDHQVKIRGYRIELGEIESQMLTHDKIKEAVVIVREETDHGKSLSAYFVGIGDEDSCPNSAELKEYLSQKLPEYMIPTYFVPLEKIPLTANGKVDRNALPEPGIQCRGDYVAPLNQMEEILVGIWADVLGIDKEKIGIDYNFFELGGDSLKAIVIISRIHKELDLRIEMVDLFRNPTVRNFAKYIKGLTHLTYVSIEPIEEKDYYPLSPAQTRLFIVQTMTPDAIGYNISSSLIMEGEIDNKTIKETFQKLIDRHESLRTSFQLVKDNPVQRVHKNIDFDLEYFAMLKAGGDEVIRNFIRPFDLDRAPLLRVGLIKETETRHFLMLDMHHIISDGTSLAIFVNEFMALYEGTGLPPLRLQYKDYVAWENSRINKGKIKTQEMYWLSVFKDKIPTLNLPYDYPRPKKMSHTGGVLEFEIGEKEADSLKSMAIGESVTLYMVLLALINLLLSKYTGQEDIVIGTFVAGRRHADLEHLIGMFVQTLALRNYPEIGKTFRQFLQGVKETTLRAYENQEYPFEKLVGKLFKEREWSRNPLIDVIFSLQNMESSDLKISGVKLSYYPHEERTANFDLNFQAVEKNGGIFFSVVYSTELFKRRTIESMMDIFMQILSNVTVDPNIILQDIILTPRFLISEVNIYKEDESSFDF